MFKKIDNSFAYSVLAGGPIINIFTIGKDGIEDGMTAAWSCPFDPDVLLVVIDKTHTTAKNIRETKKLVIALPTKEGIEDSLKLGSIHGRDDQNKLNKVKLERTENFNYPILKSSIAYFECELADENLFENKGICLAKVQHVYVQEQYWDDKEQAFVPGCFNTIHHVAGSKFSFGGTVVE